MDIPRKEEDNRVPYTTDQSRVSSSSSLRAPSSPLAVEFDHLTEAIGGKGRAKLIWDLLRCGVDPMDEFERINGGELGQKAKDRYLAYFGGNASKIRDSVSQVSQVTVAKDGTIKLLLSLLHDGLELESVIIPWQERKKSTLCISSQVGCRQGCTFCSTGRMGKLRSLTADEILSQVFHAMAITRTNNATKASSDESAHSDSTTANFPMYPIDNVVFMGMGEPGDNAAAVVAVANILVDNNQFQFAPRRVTISTIAPSPNTFAILGVAPVVLAWSVHSCRDEIRRLLVPTTRHSMVELRDGLIQVLSQRRRKFQSIMLEVTLLEGINDSKADALCLADFCAPITQRLPHGKLVVNLIPWNDIAANSGPAQWYRSPSPECVGEFQTALMQRGIRCYIRVRRGDDESAACGQLATQRHRR